MDLRLTATKRDEHGKRVRALRAAGKLPGVMYGRKTTATPLLLDTHEFERVFVRAGRTRLVDLVLDGGRAQKVLVREVQRSPRRRSPDHVDLYRVDMREKLSADVPLVIIGEAPAAKHGEADLLQLLNHIRIESLPGDIPEAIEADVSGLENVGDAVRVKDLTAPENVAILTDGEELVARAQARRAIEVEEAPVEAEAQELPESTSSVESPASEGSEEA
jgi:large subunit ribosomal protein L25